MSIFKQKEKKIIENSSNTAGTLIGNVMSENAQLGTNAAIDGMNLFRQKVYSPIVQNGQFSAQKGNLFEYIEAAKFNTKAASSGSFARAVVTDAIGDPHAAADIIIQENGTTVKEIQAKFTQSYSNGHDSSAAKSVFEQTGAANKGWGQYDGMDRLIRKQDNYNAEGSLLNEAKKIAKDRAETGGIHADTYQDVYDHLTDETTYRNVSSGGTTIEEVQAAYDAPDAYIKGFERKAVAYEMKCTAANMAKASFVTTGIVSGITNMFEVFRDKKELAEALHDVGVDAVKGGARGAATGAISTVIRYEGVKAGSKLLSDSTAATVMAGGIIDGGVALYSYARGEISAEELKGQLIDTTAKAATTIYFTKAVGAILGKAVNPIIPMVVYTTASYVVTCTREIIQNANLRAEEFERMASILQESTREMNEYHDKFMIQVERCRERQKQMLDRFINSFEYNLETGENYDEAVYAIVRFADEAGIALQNVDFKDFKRAMKSEEPFRLG